MSDWRHLLDRVIVGLRRLRENGQPIPNWVLGGGTALMLYTGHRLSKDIDAFIEDPQYLAVLSPRLSGEGVWRCEAFSESANHLKLTYPEGEIDFIVASTITDLPAERKSIDPDNAKADAQPAVVDVEHPVEIVLKKLLHRGSSLKVRDIFDIAVVDSRYHLLLRNNLRHVAHLKQAILARLSNISEEFCCEELAELDIASEWQSVGDSCLKKVREIVVSIP